MENKQVVDFARALGGAFKAQQDRLQAAEARLAELGEPVAPVINVGSPNVSVEAPLVTVEAPDLGAVTKAISDTMPGAESIAKAIGGIPAADFSALVGALEGTATPDAIGGLLEPLAAIAAGNEAVIASQAQVATSLVALAVQQEKVLAATQTQFTEIHRAMTAVAKSMVEQGQQIKHMSRVMSAPKEIVTDQDGVPFRVETKLN